MHTYNDIAYIHMYKNLVHNIIIAGLIIENSKSE